MSTCYTHFSFTPCSPKSCKGAFFVSAEGTPFLAGVPSAERIALLLKSSKSVLLKSSKFRSYMTYGRAQPCSVPSGSSRPSGRSLLAVAFKGGIVLSALYLPRGIQHVGYQRDREAVRRAKIDYAAVWFFFFCSSLPVGIAVSARRNADVKGVAPKNFSLEKIFGVPFTSV